jgi:hypothetical protein
MAKDVEIKKVVIVTKLDRAAIEQQIAEQGMAIIEPPQEDDCELEAISGDLLFWEAEIEIEEEGEDEEDDED